MQRAKKSNEHFVYVSFKIFLKVRQKVATKHHLETTTLPTNKTQVFSGT